MRVAYLLVLILFFGSVQCKEVQNMQEIKRRVPDTPVQLTLDSKVVERAEITNWTIERSSGRVDDAMQLVEERQARSIPEPSARE